MPTKKHILLACSVLVVSAVLASCDSVQPEESGTLVVEAYMRVGERPAPVLLRTTVPLDVGVGAANRAAATGALVEVDVNGERILYSESAPGEYLPPAEYDRVLEQGDAFILSVAWSGQSASAAGRIPPPIRLDSLTVGAPGEPVEAILVDTLRLDTLGVDARTGFIYPVETTVWWSYDGTPDPTTWIQTQLRPRRAFSSVVVDFFLLPEDVFKESEVSVGTNGVARWTGLYAVPVEGASDPLPVHQLRVALVRSDKAYADYAAAGSDAARRQPPTNVQGGLGIAVGLSLDSVSVEVDPAAVGRKSIVFGR